MGKLLLNEWIKFRRSKLMGMCVLTATLVPFVMMIVVMILNSNPTYTPVTVNEFMGMNLRFVVKTMSVCFYTYIATDIISREFEYDTFKSQLTIPISRITFFMVKLLTISIVLIVMSLLTFLASAILSFLMIENTMAVSTFTSYLFLFIKSGILVLPFAYFTVLMVLVFRNRFLPMALNILCFIIGIAISKYPIYEFFPWTIPSRIIFINKYDYVLHNIGYSYLTIFAFTTLCMLLGYYKIQKVEV